MTLRCTASLLKRVGEPSPDVRPTGILGDWYAKIVATKPRQLAVCTNERTLLCVVVPVAPATLFLERFGAAVKHRIDQIPVSAEARDAEVTAVSDVRLGRTLSRSVVSSLNQFGYAVEAWLEREPADDLEELGLWLCDTPCSPLKTTWPWLEAEFLLSGAIAPGQSGLRSRRSVI